MIHTMFHATSYFTTYYLKTIILGLVLKKTVDNIKNTSKMYVNLHLRDIYPILVSDEAETKRKTMTVLLKILYLSTQS